MNKEYTASKLSLMSLLILRNSQNAITLCKINIIFMRKKKIQYHHQFNNCQNTGFMLIILSSFVLSFTTKLIDLIYRPLYQIAKLLIFIKIVSLIQKEQLKQIISLSYSFPHTFSILTIAHIMAPLRDMNSVSSIFLFHFIIHECCIFKLIEYRYEWYSETLI